MERSAKRRTRSQRIGEKGEALYRAWAIDVGLTSQKVEQDYGVDFFSQVLKDIGKGIEEVTGMVLAVQVRSVEGNTRKRIKLDRADAENAVRLNIPYCLVAIDVSHGTIHHRFLDETFLRELHEFLCSDHQYLTIRVSSFVSGNDKFRTDLAQASEQGRQYRLRVLKTELKIASDIPGATLHVMQQSGFGVATIHLPWITQAFSIDSETQAKATEFVFDRGRLPPFDHPEIGIRKVFKEVADVTSGPVLLQGFFEEERILFVENDGKSYTAPFRLRHVGDERAYVAESGLVLVISGPRVIKGLHSHQLSIRITKTNATPLFKCTTSREFLTNLQPGSVLNEVGREGIPISNWPNLDKIGPAVDAIFAINASLSIDLEDVLLGDITDEEFGRSISLLHALTAGIGVERFLPGFLAGPGREQPYDESNWRRAGFRIPIALNLRNNGIIVWITGRGSVYVTSDPPLICGFRAEHQDTWQIDIKDSRLPVGPAPVAWVTTDWPGIPVMPSEEIFREGLVVKGSVSNPVGGEVWILDTDEDAPF